jgi:TetR/AcrR family transcriptional repressor of nem operon
LQAASDLFWKHGYEATSPRMLQQQSGAGQGSFYHHFKTKADLAKTVLGQTSLELDAVAQNVLEAAGSPLERLMAFLSLERDGGKGCRLGRLAQEHAIVDNVDLRAPLERYFSSLVERLANTIALSQKAGELPVELDSQDLAKVIASTIQGGYVLARSAADPRELDAALAGLKAMLRALAVSRQPTASRP